MYVIRNVFRCKPGKSTAVAEKFKNTIPLMAKLGGAKTAHVLVDYIGNYWTVVLEMQVADLQQFERDMELYMTKPEFREAMAGYTDMVEEGHREIFRIV